MSHLRTFPCPRLAALLGIALAFSSSITAAESPIESVLKVWREREAATRSLQFKLAEHYLQGAGTALREAGPPSPPTDVKTTRQRVLTIDGDKMRTEIMGPHWNDELEVIAHTNMITVFDGRFDKTFAQTSKLYGYISIRDKHADVNNVYLSPVLRHYRALSPAFGLFDTEKWRIVSTEESVRGIPCILIDEQRPKDVTRRYWVAPGQEMSVVRYLKLWRGMKLTEAEVSFRKDEKHGWIPDRWTASVYVNDERRTSSCESSNTEFKINVEVPDSAFDIEFPQGTEVSDRVNKRTFRVE